jgi:hypothetical protein
VNAKAFWKHYHKGIENAETNINIDCRVFRSNNLIHLIFCPLSCEQSLSRHWSALKELLISVLIAPFYDKAENLSH